MTHVRVAHALAQLNQRVEAKKKASQPRQAEEPAKPRCAPPAFP